MSRLSSAGSSIFGALDEIVDFAWVSILWIVFSLPLVTAGASTTAFYYTVTKVIRHNRGYIWREFWGSFKSNFKQSTIIWLLYAAVMMLLTMDIRIMDVAGGTVALTFRYIFIIGMVMATAVVLYALAYTARFVQNVKHIVLNSVLMAVRHLPKTLLVLVVIVVGAFGVYLMPISIVLVPAIAGIIISAILESVFVQYMSEEDKEKENLRNYAEQYEYVNRKDEE